MFPIRLNDFRGEASRLESRPGHESPSWLIEPQEDLIDEASVTGPRSFSERPVVSRKRANAHFAIALLLIAGFAAVFALGRVAGALAFSP